MTEPQCRRAHPRASPPASRDRPGHAARTGLSGPRRGAGARPDRRPHGAVTFTEYFHLLLTGEEPTGEQRFFLDLLLVAIAEHGMMPTSVAARMTLAADPRSLQGAVAAGILGCGPVVLGPAAACARLRSGEHTS